MEICILICHVTSPDHLIERSCGLMGGVFLYYVPTLSLAPISIVIMETFLICHVTSREHMFKGLCEFMGGSRLR